MKFLSACLFVLLIGAGVCSPTRPDGESKKTEKRGIYGGFGYGGGLLGGSAYLGHGGFGHGYGHGYGHGHGIGIGYPIVHAHVPAPAFYGHGYGGYPHGFGGYNHFH